MPRLKVALKQNAEWNLNVLEDWEEVFKSFFIQKGKQIEPRRWEFPGYYIVEVGKDTEWGEITLSQAERIVAVKLSFKKEIEEDFAYFLLGFARQIGAKHLFISMESDCSAIWRKLGAVNLPDPKPISGKIKREKVGVDLLADFGLSITYQGWPVLCLEPIPCNNHSTSIVSLAQKKLERIVGGSSIGFTSRMAVNSPWKIDKVQWEDLLAYSRLECYEVLYKKVSLNEENF